MDSEEKPFIRCLIFAWSFDRTDILTESLLQ